MGNEGLSRADFSDLPRRSDLPQRPDFRYEPNRTVLVPRHLSLSMIGRKPTGRKANRCVSAILAGISLCWTLSLATGCSSLINKDAASDSKKPSLDLFKVPEPPELIRQATAPRGLRPVPIQGIGMVNSLNQTGGTVDPSRQRDDLIEEMHRNNVRDANQWLESTDTAMVEVIGAIPPGARRGDPLDLRIISPRSSRANDLNGGWLLDTRMRHQRSIGGAAGGRTLKSDLMALATGEILTRQVHEIGDESALRREGRVLGGGIVQSTRKLGLVLRPEYRHVQMASGIAGAINKRFFFFDGTTRRGIAKAIEDDYLEVEIHPRYSNNVYRMMAVTGAIGLRNNGSESQAQLAELGEKLRDPKTGADAALQLEAIGESAIPTLTVTTASSNPELRFYASESLVYLDRAEGIEPLIESIREEAAFRQPAFMALQGMNNRTVVAALKTLLDESSLETRYGAFATIQKRKDGRQAMPGKVLGDTCKFFSVPSRATPAVVVSLRERPEIITFGEVAPLNMSGFLLGPSGIVVKPDPNDPSKMRISRFEMGKDDRRAIAPRTVRGLVEGAVAVGGQYGDIIHLLRIAKSKGYLTDQLKFDPLPAPFRTYYRDNQDEEEETSAQS